MLLCTNWRRCACFSSAGDAAPKTLYLVFLNLAAG
jgi:hypothetical protein